MKKSEVLAGGLVAVAFGLAVWACIMVLETHRKSVSIETPKTSGTIVMDIPKMPEDPGWLKQLRAVAKDQKVNFAIYCWQENDFFAVAWPYGAKRTRDIEDGGQGEWIARQPTQELAGTELMEVIYTRSGDDWFPPKHKEPLNEKKTCPSEITGGEDK